MVPGVEHGEVLAVGAERAVAEELRGDNGGEYRAGGDFHATMISECRDSGVWRVLGAGARFMNPSRARAAIMVVRMGSLS